MKKIIYLVIAIIISASPIKAQTNVSQKENPAFIAAMLNNIRQLDTASTATTLIALANNFERIGNAENTKWEPFYYASYCYAAMAFLADKNSIDRLADKSEAYLQKAEENSKGNSEISCLYAMINSCRILVDPVSRFQAKGKEVQMLLGKAKEENASNPRIYLLQARMLMRTPEAFGGGKEPAKKAIDAAISKFKSFHTENPVAPDWGFKQATSIQQSLNAQ